VLIEAIHDLSHVQTFSAASSKVTRSGGVSSRGIR
jgi:hypothetical protein